MEQGPAYPCDYREFAGAIAGRNQPAVLGNDIVCANRRCRLPHATGANNDETTGCAGTHRIVCSHPHPRVTEGQLAGTASDPGIYEWALVHRAPPGFECVETTKHVRAAF